MKIPILKYIIPLITGIVLLCLPSTAQTTAQIGTGTSISSTTLYGPIYRYSSTSSTRQFRSNIIYEASELAAVGIIPGSVIQSIAFNKPGVEGTNSAPLDYQVYMANTSNTPPLTTGTAWSAILATHTLVYSNANQQVPTSPGWVTFQFQPPFTYTGGSLEIAFEGEFVGPSPYTTGKIDWEYTSGFSDNIIGGTGSSSKPTTLNGSASSYLERANIQITFVSTAGNCANSFSDFTTDSISGDAFKVDWTPGTGNSSFYLEYGVTGFTPGTGTKVTGSYPSSSGPPVVISGLSPETTYDVYFGEICNSGADSIYFMVPSEVTTTKACGTPANFGDSAITANSTDLFWDAIGGVTYNVLYGPAGFNPNTGGSTVMPSSSPYTLSGLQGNTSYDIYLYADCGTDGLSDTTAPLTITTECGTYTAPYFNDFENDELDLPPGCWSAYETYSAAWVEVEDHTGAAAPYAGDQALYLYSSSSSTSPGADTLMAITPQFTDLPVGDKQIRFYGNSDDPQDKLIVGTIPSPSAHALFTPIDTIEFQTPDTYEEVIVPFTTANGYNGTDEYIVLAHNLAVTTDYIRIDDFHYEVMPACPEVTQIKLDSVDVTSASFSFRGTGSSFDVEFGPVGFLQGQGCTGNFNGTSITIDNNTDPGCLYPLTGNSDFEIYIRNNCTGSSNGTSSWEGPFTFTTACGVLSTPHTESFDSTSIPDCWSTYSSTSETWTFGTNTYAPSSDHTGNNGEYATVDDSESPATPDATLESPLFDVSNLTNPELEFFLASENATVTLTVDVWDGTTWNTGVYTHAAASVNTWDEISVNLIPYAASGEIAVRFVVDEDNGGSQNDIAIDDVTIQSGPACPDPGALAISGLTDTSVVLEWSPSLTGAQSKVWFGPQGFFQGSQTAPGSGNYIIVNTDNLVLNTLSPNTCYEFGVLGLCTATDSSEWVGAYSFCTPCAGETAPYAENFDGTVEPNINSCWSVINTTTSTGYIETYDGGSPPAFSAPNLVEIYNGATTSGDMILVTPLLEDMDNSKLVRFQFHNEDLNANDLIIGTLSNPSDETTFTPYDTIFESELEDDLWHEVRVMFSSYTGTDQYIGIKVNLNATYDYVFIDDFKYENFTCPYPTSFQSTGATNTSIDLNWTTGGATNWQIEYGPVGFTPGTGTIVNAGTNPFTLSGLNSGALYDIYVRDSCGAGDVSLWTGPVLANTTCSPLAAGTYTLGGGSADYATFEDAANALNLCGVSGPVNFNIQPGTYTGKLHLIGLPGLYSGVPGVSATNTITFTGSGNDTLIWDGTGPQAAVLLDSTGHVTLNGMTIINDHSSEAWGVLVTNHSDSVTITNCTILMDSTSTSTDRSAVLISGSYENDIVAGAEVDYLTLTNSTLVGGYYTVTLQGNSASDLSVGHVVSDNIIREFYYYGIDLDDLEDVTITGNTITARASANVNADGIYAYDVNDYRIEGNYVHAPDYGLYLFDGNDGFTPAIRSTVINNMIISDADYGMYLNDFESTDVFHNTVVGEPAIAINDQVDVNIQNNIFVSENDFAFESFDALNSGDIIDHNLYYKSGAGDAFDIGTSTYTTLADWQSGDATRNVNSVEGDPVFVSATDLHVIGGLANNGGIDTLGVTVDIDGDPRSATTPDMGADEYTPVAGDLALIAGNFIKGLCLSVNDSVELMIRNLVSPVDFSNDPLTVNYDVTGPVNTSGSVTITTGTLAVSDTVIVYGVNIDLSMPGTYTLDAYLDPNTVNVFDHNDTLVSITLEVDSEFVARPSVVTLPGPNDSTEICVESPFIGGGFMITEQSHYDYSVGRPSPDFPAYLVADDYIEITGAPGADLGGITLEQWEGTSLVNSFTFSSGTVLSPDGTAIIAVGQDRGSTPSPADFYYHGDVTHTWGSGDNSGRVLKDGSGNVIDAVGYGTYTFPAASGVTAADWSGTTGSATTTAGVRLIGPDINDGSNWIVSSATNTQDPNTVNSGVPVPVGSAAGLTWTLVGSSTVIDTTTCITVGPYSGPGTYQYVASFSNSCGAYTDTVTVIVPTCFAPAGISGGVISQSSVGISWDTTGTGATNFEVEYGPLGYTPGTGTVVNVSGDSTDISGLTANLCQDFYVRASCSSTDKSIWVGPATLCPDETICTDSLEQYAVGPIDGQSSLFKGWYGTGAGAAAISTAQANSGAQSLYIPADGTSDMVAYFDTIDGGGMWNIKFAIYVPSGTEGYYNVQRNYTHGDPNQTNIWAFDVNLEANGTATVDGGTYGGTAVATFSYNPGQWNTIEHIIDLTNDSVHIRVNGAATNAKWQYSFADLSVPLQFNAVNFYSNSNLSNPDYYVDDFCVEPYSPTGCPAPSSLNAGNEGCDSAEVSWNSASGNTNNSSIVEYGPVGFTPGTGTFISFVNSPEVITGLTPGTDYDFYVADTCGVSDTSNFAGPYAFTTLSGPLPVASFTPSVNGFIVDFDATASTGATTYDWDFGDAGTGNGDMISHTYATGGSFSVTLTVSNSCGTDDTTIVITDVSLEENILEQSLVVYPNPATDEVNIGFDNSGSGDATIRVMDLSGKQIMVKHFENLNENPSHTLNIDHLADGVYMLEISSGSIKATKRLLKQ